MAKISDNYEVVYILDPALGEEAIAATVEKFKALEKKGEMTEDDRKDYEKELQDLTDKRCKEIDELTVKKEAELMAV